MSEPMDLTYEELNGEIVVLDAEAQMVHRIAGDTAEAVRAEGDEMTRRRMIRAAVALGVAAGVSSIALPSAAAAASGGGGEPEFGSSYSGYAGDPGVSAATGVNAVGGSSMVTVTWNAVSGATGYRVYRKRSVDSTYTLAWSGSATSAEVAQLDNGVSYDFIVVTVKSGLVSAQSAAVSATPVALAPPAVPTNLGATHSDSGPSTWTLTWSKGAGVTPTSYFVKCQTVYGEPVGAPVEVYGTTLVVSDIGGYLRFQVAARFGPEMSDYSGMATFQL